MLRAQVEAIRASAAAQVAMADAILRALEVPRSSVASPAAVSIEKRDEPCQHPPERRLSVARMGAADAWLCTCGVEGEGA